MQYVFSYGSIPETSANYNLLVSINIVTLTLQVTFIVAITSLQ